MGKRKEGIAGEPTLGDLVRDRITEFEGIVIAETKWLNMCTRLTVQSRKLKDDQKSVDMTFDITDLLLIERDPLGYRLPPTPKRTGGPPPRGASDPTR